MWEQTLKFDLEIQGIKTPYTMHLHQKSRSEFSVIWAELRAADGKAVMRFDYPALVSQAHAQSEIRRALAARVAIDRAHGVGYAQAFDYGKWQSERAAQQQRRSKKK